MSAELLTELAYPIAVVAELLDVGTEGLLRRPALVGGYVEEILRLAGPVKLAVRTATADRLLAGQRVHAGQQVAVSTAQVNRGPERFEDPDRFDPGRTRSHLAFSAGAYFCLGAALARMEAEEALTRLFARFPTPRLAPGTRPAWRASGTFHALRELPVELAPGRRPARAS